MVQNNQLNGNHTVLEAKEPLQKLTESLCSPTSSTGPEERKSIEDSLNKRLKSLKGDDLDRYWDEVEKSNINEEVKDDLRKQRWENNHQEIIRSISKLIRENEQIPTKLQIAIESGFSRQTVHKHLTEFSKSPLYEEEFQKLKILNHRILAKLYRSAAEGSVKASRLFFEMTGALGNRNTNNFFIQINNVRLDEKIIKKLPQSAILEIESIITKSIPQQLNDDKNNAN